MEKNSFAQAISRRQEERQMFEGVVAIGEKARLEREALANANKAPAPAANPAPTLSPEEAMFEAIENSAINTYRALGMAALIAWVDVGEPSAEDFDLTAQGMADIDEDGEVSEMEEEAYNETLFSMAQGLRYIGVDAGVVDELLAGSDKAASTAYVAMANKLEAMDITEDELIAEFSVQQEGMFEAKKKVIRDGETKWVNKPLKKRRLTAAQRAGLKKARMKSHSAAARAKRKKSMRKRAASGL